MRNDERLRTIYEVMAPYIVRSERNWRDYLAFASRFHKQSFDNILLVYAQDEDVTILASKKQWASVGRNLISRPKGIAVCVYSNARLTLDYLFDISQTVGREIHPTNWRLSDEMQKALGERLTFSHGFQAQPFPDLLYALARESVNDNYEHYLQGLRQETKNHLFEEIPAGGFEAQYIQLLTDSVSYFIGKKCHLPDDAIRTSDGMATVNHFNTVPLVAHLGMAVTSISKAVLLEMERNIRIINRERKVQYDKPNINLNYKEQGGMLLPDLHISNSSEADRPLGRYGRMALEYLKDNQPERYTILKMDGSLMEVMHRVQDEAMEKIEALTQQMLQQEPMPQTEDILERTRHLNDLKLMAEETVLQTIVLIPR